ncbi:MAG TPA: glutamate-1-semialdehyde-2,1-aminomutase [Lentisphaeria bacterium]|nr:MAG: glutamate-1-semialdehyde-2,1-aminomutase [Lentisphaerae bacterium GWF2_49_21]HBC88915.1 glutamate-1-semialdehyde-2,1-aminomutase [Lentisphaeria bacterium]
MKKIGNRQSTIGNVLFKRAEKLIPGGVNSPVRAFRSVGGNPVYMKKGQGAYVFDTDRKRYIDFCGSWGPLILGHARREVVEAVQKAAADGMSFGTCTPREVEMAELLTDMVPYLEMVRMVTSGTEAVMTAIRLARGFTGRNKILKFDGCYHGHADYLLVAAGSGLLTGGISSSAGVPAGAVNDVFVCAYNDIAAVEKIFSKHGNDIAAVIVEPVAGNMGLVKPELGFLESLRKLTKKSGSLLIFDEVITGFRLGPTTYGKICGITPDLTTLGKIIGGGMPIGALGGKAAIMKKLAPLGPVYQAGTLSGNPVALAAGIETLKILKKENPYPRLAKFAKKIECLVNKKASEKRLGVHCVSEGGMFTIFFTGRKPLRNLEEIRDCDTAKFADFFRSMLKKGIYLSPSQFEVGFISAAHSEKDIGYLAGLLKEYLTKKV